MWLYLRNAFVSIVQHHERHDLLVVRARNRKHLEELGFQKIQRTRDTDYEFRVIVTRPRFLQMMMRQVEHLTYTNYKDASRLKDDVLWKVYNATLDI
jgi:hypothetical protein